MWSLCHARKEVTSSELSFDVLRCEAANVPAVMSCVLQFYFVQYILNYILVYLGLNPSILFIISSPNIVILKFVFSSGGCDYM